MLIRRRTVVRRGSVEDPLFGRSMILFCSVGMNTPKKVNKNLAVSDFFINFALTKNKRDMNEKLKNAFAEIDKLSEKLYSADMEAIELIKDILRPCDGQPCPIGTEDFADDIFYAYGEPKPNQFRRVLAIRLNKDTDELEAQLEGEPIGLMGEDGWTPFGGAYIGDIRFLIDEISANIEYADGYQDE